MGRKYSEKGIQELAASYALGALDKRESDEFEKLLQEGCQLCENELQDFRKVVSQLGYSAPPVSPQPDLKRRLLGRLRRETQATHRAGERTGFLFVRSNKGEWEEIAKDVNLKHLFVDSERQYTMVLVRMSASASFPKHRHAETEECYVIDGDIQMGSQVFRADDYIRAEAETIHESIYTGNGCTLLLLSSQVSDIFE